MTKTRQMKLNLPNSVAEALSMGAEITGQSESDLAANLLAKVNVSARGRRRVIQAVRTLDTLPSSLVDVTLDHPVFSPGKSRRGPFPVQAVPRNQN